MPLSVSPVFKLITLRPLPHTSHITDMTSLIRLVQQNAFTQHPQPQDFHPFHPQVGLPSHQDPSSWSSSCWSWRASSPSVGPRPGSAGATGRSKNNDCLKQGQLLTSTHPHAPDMFKDSFTDPAKPEVEVFVEVLTVDCEAGHTRPLQVKDAPHHSEYLR